MALAAAVYCSWTGWMSMSEEETSTVLPSSLTNTGAAVPDERACFGGGVLMDDGVSWLFADKGGGGE